MAAFSSEVYRKLVSAMTSASAAQEILDVLKGEDVFTHRVGGSTAEVAQRFGATETEGLEVRVIDETVTLTNDASVDLTSTIPAGAVIRSVQANLETAVTGDGTGDNLGAVIGIGPSGDTNKYGATTALTQDAKVDTIPTHAVLGSAEQIALNMLQVDGATASTEAFTAGGSVRVRIVFEALNSLDNAS